MMNKQTGQCLCGAMKYEVSADPIRSSICHCSHCQKASGSAYSINIIIPREAFKIIGKTLVTYLDRGGSGKELRRYFCSTCGSPLYTETDAMPNFTIVKAGTLNDTTNFKPNINIFCESKMDWLKQCNKTVDFEKAPSQ